MERLAEQPPALELIEEIDQYRRHYNDTATWLAEALDGSMRTPFEYQFDGNELYADDGSALGPIFDTAIDTAHQLQVTDSRLGFELRRRRIERTEYDDMLDMMRGNGPNTMIVVSDFPAELQQARVDVGGYNVTRKQTMLRVLTRHGGRLQMYSQSLDGSDRDALTGIYRQFGVQPAEGELLGQRIRVEVPDSQQKTIIDRLTAVYDQNLQQRYGGNWYAGRQELACDTYRFVLSQHDVLDHFVQRRLSGAYTNENLYDVAALLSKRFEAYKRPRLAISVEPAEVVFNVIGKQLEYQLLIVGQEARAAGKSFSGCGISVGAEGSAEQQYAEAGYGNQSDDETDKYGSLTFECKNGHTNRRQRGKLLTSCRVPGCKNSVSC